MTSLRVIYTSGSGFFCQALSRGSTICKASRLVYHHLFEENSIVVLQGKDCHKNLKKVNVNDFIIGALQLTLIHLLIKG